MKKINNKKILVFIGIFFTLLLIMQVKSYAGSFSISCYPSGTVEPGSTVTISITGNNATGKVNITATNITLNNSSVWIEDNTKTITGIAGADGTTAKITATATDVSDSTTGDPISGSKSLSIAIKKKEIEVKPVIPTKNNETTTNTNKNTSTNTNKKNNNTKDSKKTNQNTQITVKQQEEKKEEDETHKIGVYYLYIEAVNENGEKEEIKLDKEFNYDIYEYNCTVNEKVQKLEIQKEAYEYNDLVEIIGADEIKYGENIITIKIKKDEQEVIYNINVLKEGKKEIEETKNEINENKTEEQKEKKSIIISMPLVNFILLQLGIILLEIIICIIIVKLKNHCNV